MPHGLDAVPGGDRWFGSVDLRGAPDAALSVIHELVRMLDETQPQLLDQRRSHVRSSGDRTVEIELAHQTESDCDVSVAVDSDQAVVSWLSAHEHVDESDAVAGRPWTTVVVDVVHSVLRGEYEVENHYWRKRLLRTKIIDTGDPAGPRVMEEQGPLLALLPWPRVTHVARRRVDFGLRD